MKLTCTDCSLKKVGCVGGYGQGNQIMIVCDRPSLEDVNKGESFSGKMGEQIKGYLQAAGIPMSMVYMTNIVKGYVKQGASVSVVAIRKCVPYLYQEIQSVKPKVIVLMGATAYKGFKGKAAPGTVYFDEQYQCWVVCTHHPMKPLYSGQESEFTDLISAFKLALQYSTGTKSTAGLEKPPITVVRSALELQTVLPTILQYDLYGVDCETTGLNIHKDKLLTLGLSNGKVNVGIVVESDMLPAINQIFAHIRMIGHNIKFDLQVLRKAGIEVKNPYADTMLMHYVLDPQALNHDLASICLKEFQTSFDKNIDYSTFFEGGITPEKQAILAERGTLDAYLSFLVFEKFESPVRKLYPKFYFETVMPICCLLAEIEFNGVRINTDELYKTDTVLKYTLKSKEEDLLTTPELIDFACKEGLDRVNLGSPKQMSNLLYKYLKIPENKEEGKTTSKDVLEKLNEKVQNPIVSKLLAYRNLAKLQSTYINGIREALDRSDNDRIHVNYSQDRVVTGRLSCSKPNLQTIPNEKSVENADIIRKMFCSQEGYSLMEMDFKQLEFRVWAHMSRDAAMLNMIQEGGDVHKKMAAKINGITEDQVTDEQRYQAKEISFGLIYGMGVGSLSARTKISLEEATRIKNDFFSTFPEATVWLTQVADFGLKNKFVTTPFGRRIPIVYNPNDKEDVSSAKRRAVNYPVQSTAAELTNMVGVMMYSLVKEAGIRARIVLNVHDSLVWEVHDEDIQKLKPIALQAIDMMVAKLSFRAVLAASFKIGKNLEEQSEL